MADEPENEEEGVEEPEGKSSVLPWIAVGILCTGGGAAIPFLFPAGAPLKGNVEETEPSYELPAVEDTTFVPFEEVVVNLDDGRMTRFLRVGVTLQVAKDKEAEITALLETKKPVLKNWLLSQISEKTLEDIRGPAGQNRLRREIRDQFNMVLFPDGFDRIYDVLFDEFGVQ